MALAINPVHEDDDDDGQSSAITIDVTKIRAMLISCFGGVIGSAPGC